MQHALTTSNTREAQAAKTETFRAQTDMTRVLEIKLPARTLRCYDFPLGSKLRSMSVSYVSWVDLFLVSFDCMHAKQTADASLMKEERVQPNRSDQIAQM